VFPPEKPTAQEPDKTAVERQIGRCHNPVYRSQAVRVHDCEGESYMTSCAYRLRSWQCPVVIVLLLTTLLMTGTCSKKPTRPEPGAFGQANITLLIPKALQEAIDQVLTLVTAADMDTIRQFLTIQDSVATGTIQDIPAGPNRLFTVNVYKTGGILSHTGKDSTDILGGQTVDLEIELIELQGNVNLIASFPGWWYRVADMPTPRSYTAAGVMNGKLYVAGGMTTGGETSTLTGVLEIYDPASDSWTPGAPMGTPRQGAAAGVIGNLLYVAGGRDATSYSGVLESYNPDTNTWTTRNPMPTLRNQAAAAVWNGKLYVMGGENASSGTLDTLQVYDPASNIWTTLASMPAFKGRRDHAAAAIGDTIWVVGGATTATATSLLAYHPGTDTWFVRSNIPTPRYGPAAAVLNGRLYVAGGYGTVGTPGETAVLEIYDPSTGIWSTKRSMQYARAAAARGLLVVNGRFYVAGGFLSTQKVAAVEFYRP
jgi:N-acetylneuraminic acid mutarotase